MIVTIDPGKKGGAALWLNDGRLAGTYQFDMPSQPRFPTWEAISTYQSWLPPKRTTVMVMESLPDFRTVGAVKHKNTQGAVWGSQYIATKLRCPNIHSHIVEARLWKKHFGISSDKKEALALAREIHPECDGIWLEKNDGVAEAILIGHYYFDVIKDSK